MTILPTAENLGRRAQVRDRGGIATKRTGMVGAAIQDLAGTVEQIEKKAQAKEDRLNYAQARSSLLQADIAARSEFDGDPDWATYENRYSEKMKQAKSDASSMIKSTSDKALFDVEAQSDIARGLGAIGQKAWKGEVDTGRAGLAFTLDANRTSGLSSSDFATKIAFINSTDEALSGAREKGYIDEVEAVTMKKKWTDDFAESSILMMEPDKRVAVLSSPNGTLAANIPADRRKALLESAKRENKEIVTRAKAQEKTDVIVKKGGSLEAQLKEARKIQDPEVRDSAVTRVTKRYKEAEIITSAVQSEALDAGYKVAFDGGLYDEIAPSVLAAMDPKDALNLKSYMNKGGVVKTNKKTWYDLTKMKTDDPRKFADLDMLKYRNVLNDGDWKAMVKGQSDMKDTKEVSFQLRSDNQLVDDTLRAIGVSPAPKDKAEAEKVYSFRYQYQETIDSFQKQEKRKATVDEKQKILDRMTMVVTSEDAGWAYFDEDIRVFEVKEGDILVDLIVPDEERKEIIAALESGNREVTEQAILAWYRKSLNASR